MAQIGKSRQGPVDFPFPCYEVAIITNAWRKTATQVVDGGRFPMHAPVSVLPLPINK